MEIMKKCWVLLIVTISIVWAGSPDSITNENKIDASRTVRQTVTFSQSNSNGNIKRRQPIPRRAIRILDPNYVAKNFGTTIPGNNVNKNSNGIPSPYLVQQNDQESFNKVDNNLSIVKNAYNSFIGNNDNSASKNNEKFNHVSQSYDYKENLQFNVNQQNPSTSTTTDNIEENLILKKPSIQILTGSENKNNNSFIHDDKGKNSVSNNDGFNESNYFSEEKNTSENSKDNLLYDYAGLLSQLTENDFKNFAINFASKEDIHTDSDDINAFGLSLLSNDGLNSKRSVGVPLSQSDVVKRTPQDAIVLGQDNNQIIIAKENSAANSNSGISGNYGEPLPLNNLGSNDRSSQQFTIQGDFQSFGNQGGSYSSSQSSSSNNINSPNSNQQQFITVRDGDSFETFGNNAASFGVPIPSPVNNPDPINNNYNSNLETITSQNQGGSVGIPLPFTENYDFKQGDTTQNANQGGTGIPLPSISSDNSNNNINYQDNVQGESFQSSNQGGTGIPLPSIVSDNSNSNNIKYQDNVQGESIQSNNQGGSFGIPLPSSITGSAGQTQDNIQVDSVLKAINGFGSGNQENIEQMIGGMTIGQLLNGINGQNGIMVIPESSAPGLGIQINSNSDQKISIREGSNEAVVVESSTTTTSAPAETSAPRTRANRRRTTTPPPDHLRRSLSDLLYAKGQWFGTLIGGLIDYGQIVQDAYKKTLGADSRPPYGS